MSKVAAESASDAVRRFVREKYIEPARRRGERKVSINVGEVHKELGLRGRVPLVCSALRGSKFLEENRLEITEQSGPPSGMSTTVTLTYQIAEAGGGEKAKRFEAFLRLRGIGREVFRELGGGEEFIRSERRAWDKSSNKESAS